jgi:predicted dehydrogenase
MDPAASGGGIFDLLIHDADFCLQLFGKPHAVLAAGYEDMAAGIDWVDAQLFYPHGVVTISGGWHNRGPYPFSSDYTVVLDGGTIEYGPAAPGPVFYGHEGKPEPLPVAEADGYASEIEYFVECCRAGRAPALCPPADSAAAVKLMRLIVDARRMKGEKIPCTI